MPYISSLANQRPRVYFSLLATLGLIGAVVVPWLLVTLLVAAAGSGLGAAASAQGTSWAPDDSAPFSDVRLPGWL